MSGYSDAPLDRLWKEYSGVFREFDDLTLARWMAQTLGQIEGRIWRLSHPLINTYRLAAQVGHDRQIWHKRLVTAPSTYRESSCCRAPLLPLFTRDIAESGLACQHCSEICAEWSDLPPELQAAARPWAEEYSVVHAVAHWDDAKRRLTGDYETAVENAAVSAEGLLADAARMIVPKFLEHFPTIVWEDQDECLEVRAEDIEL